MKENGVCSKGDPGAGLRDTVRVFAVILGQEKGTVVHVVKGDQSADETGLASFLS